MKESRPSSESSARAHEKVIRSGTAESKDVFLQVLMRRGGEGVLDTFQGVSENCFGVYCCPLTLQIGFLACVGERMGAWQAAPLLPRSVYFVEVECTGLPTFLCPQQSSHLK